MIEVYEPEGIEEAQRSLGQRLLADEIIEADRLDPLAERELVSTRVHDPQPIQFQVVQGVTHRGRKSRRVGALELEAHALLAAHDEEVKFSPRVGRPKVAFLRSGTQVLHGLVESESLPRRSHLRMIVNS